MENNESHVGRPRHQEEIIKKRISNTDIPEYISLKDLSELINVPKQTLLHHILNRSYLQEILEIKTIQTGKFKLYQIKKRIQ